MSKEAIKLALEAITAYLSESPDPSEEAVEGLCDARAVLRQALAEQPAYRAVKTYHEGKPVYVAEQPAPQVVDCHTTGVCVQSGLRAEQPAQQKPVNLRRGDLLRCIETDELCTVWATSPTGNTLIKWSANNFGNYTAEQIGELFWLEPAQQEPVAEIVSNINGRLSTQLSDDWTPNPGDKLYTTPQPAQREPLTVEELEAAWNAQADKFNQWDELGLDEIVAWAQAANNIKENT